MADVETELSPTYQALLKIGITDDPGFYDVRMDAKSMTLTVSRVGGAEALGDDVERKFASVVPSNVSLKFDSSIITRAQENELLDTINNLALSEIDKGFLLQSWHLETPMGPFVVLYDPSGPPTPDDFISRLPAFSHKIIQFRPGAISMASRNNDTSPFYGGARVNHPGGSCSSGFGVRNFDNNVDYYLTTAWHCLNPNSATARNGVGVIIGTGMYPNADRDTTFIRPSVGQTADQIFTGSGLTSTTNMDVAGTYPPESGREICQSGSVTFLKCGLYVLNSNINVGYVTTNSETGQQVPTRGFIIDSFSEVNHSVALGDSGGPVIYINSFGAWAVGGVSAGSGYVPCPSYITNNECFRYMYASPMHEIAAWHHLSFSF